MTGAAIGQLAVLAAMPFLTRLYGPDSFGVLALVNSTIGILATISALRYEWAIPIQKARKDAIHLVNTCLVILSCSVIIYTVISSVVVLKRVTIFSLDPGTTAYLLYVPVGVLFLGGYQVLSFYFVREGSYKILSISKAVQGFAIAVFCVINGLIFNEPAGLVIGYMSGFLCAFLILFSAFPRRNIDLKKVLMLARQNIRFAKISFPSSLINSIGAELPTLMLAFMYNSTVVGLYSLSQRAVLTPLGVVSKSWGQVYCNDLSRLVRNDNMRDARQLYVRHVAKLTILFSPIVISIAGAAPYLFGLVFGEKWWEAGLYLRYLSPMFLLYFLSVPLSQTLFLVNKQDKQFKWDLARMIILVSTFFCAHMYGFSVRATLIVYSTGGAILYAVLMCITYSSLYVKEVPDEKSKTAR